MKGYRWGASILAGAGLMLLVGCPVSPEAATYLGVQVENATVDGLGGVLVTQQTQNPGLSTARLLANDIIVSITLADGEPTPVTTVAQLRQALAKVAVGRAVRVDVYRPAFATDGTPMRGTYRDRLPLTLQVDAETGGVPTFLGLHVVDNGGTGVRVVAVPEDPDALGSLRVDDVIIALDSTSITSVESFRGVLARAASGSRVTFRYRREGTEADLTSPVDIGPEANRDLPLVGLTVQELTTELAGAWGYGKVTGVRISALLFDTPALRSALMAGDVITGVKGEADRDEVQATSSSVFAAAIAERRGEQVAIRYVRGKTPRTPTEVRLLEEAVVSDPAPNIGLGFRAVDVETLSPAGGALVVSVYPGGPANQAGIREQDVILSVERVAVANSTEFWQRVDDLYAGSNRTVMLETLTDGVPQFRNLLLTPSPLPASTQPSS